MAKAKSELTWSEIDPASLPQAQADLYAAYKQAYRAMKEAREAFETSLQSGAPHGMRIVCGYNFGKLSLALAPAEEKPARAKASGSLADFLASQQASGRRA